MQIKLICSDIDGTLLNKDRELSANTITQIKRLASISFILISSRMPKAMLHLQKELEIEHLPIIAYNGGLILADNKIISSTEISTSTSESIAYYCKETNLHISLYHNDEWYVTELDYWAKREANNTKINPKIQNIKTTLIKWKSENKGAHKIMVMGDADEISSLVDYINKNLANEVIGYRSKETYLEIAHTSISKKTAIDTLIDSHYPKITLKNILAFGDNYNDIEMLKSVGIGVAVANARKEVLDIADAITDGNKEDGVANYLKNHF
ncbi:MAG: HAD family hydrolase [Urechidicola sp.]|nr:HAD family hydrolase [Urechidicola sp.]